MGVPIPVAAMTIYTRICGKVLLLMGECRVNKPEKAMIALLSAQLDVLLALLGQRGSGKAGSEQYSKQVAAAAKVADLYRPASKKVPSPKKSKHR